MKINNMFNGRVNRVKFLLGVSVFPARWQVKRCGTGVSILIYWWYSYNITT